MTNPADLSYLHFLSDDERARQRAIIRARKYHEDQQVVELTDRLKQFLAIDGDQAFILNVAAIVVEAAAERLHVIGFDSDEEPDAEGVKPDAEGVKPVAAWAWELWQRNRMDGVQDEVHEGAVRDGEYFLLVDGDDVNRRARFTPHQRYTALYDYDGKDLGGDEEGIRVFYANNNETGPIVRAVKHWSETVFEDDKGRTRRRVVRRMNVYYPDRMERYQMEKGAWQPMGGKPWIARDGSPLGVPVIHFRNTNMRCEAARAWPIQDAINKAFVDLVAAEDIAALGILVTLGFFPTTDGQPPRADGANALLVQPGAFLSTSKGPSDAAAQRIPGEDLTQLITAIDAKIKWLAGITSTPPSRFQASTNVRAEGTLKQEEGPLLAKLEPKMTLLGNAWEDAFYLARRIEETFYGASLPADAVLSAQWAPTATRDEKEEREALTLEHNLGVPLRFLLPKLGYSEWEISEIIEEKEAEAQKEMERQQQMAAVMPRSVGVQN